MTSMWRRAMLYLGLGPDEEYEEDYEEPAGYGAPAPAQPPPSVPPPEAHSGVRALPREEPAIARPRPVGGGVVRPITPVPAAKIARVTPTAFNDAQEVADKFKAGQGVVVNLEGLDREIARRIIDFASGLCYGLSGQMERVGRDVYLLTPSNVEVSAEEKRRLQERSQA